MNHKIDIRTVSNSKIYLSNYSNVLGLHFTSDGQKCDLHYCIT